MPKKINNLKTNSSSSCSFHKFRLKKKRLNEFKRNLWKRYLLKINFENSEEINVVNLIQKSLIHLKIIY